MIPVPRTTARMQFLVVLVTLVGAQGLAAQQQDTLPPPDTAVVAQDTILPPPVLAPWPRDARRGWGRAAWSWTRDELQGTGAITLLDLLRTVPGVTTLRAGAYVQPETATVFGGGAGRIQVEIDGFVLDPLTGPTLDLSTVQLAMLDLVRVERGLNRLRIILHTTASEDARTFSRIEAFTGEPSANVFRGLLLAPRFVAGPFGFGVERTEGQEAGRTRPADAFGTWVKWSVLNADRGLQLEWRGTNFNRDPDSAVPLEGRRSDLIVRGRNQFAPGVLGEVWAGWSSETLDPNDPVIPDSLRISDEGSSRQIGLRGAFVRERFAAEAALRFRNNELLPGWQADVQARYSPLERADLSLRATTADWPSGRITEYATAARYQILDGVHVFGEYATGGAGAPVRGDTLRTAPVISDRTAWRAGVEVDRFGIRAGGAMLKVETDSVATFGFPSDSVGHVTPGGSVTGWEAWARVPLRGDWLSGSVSYSSWQRGRRWAYLPASALRASLDLHSVPLASGNLELIGRLELLQRGTTAMPPLIAADPPFTLASRNQINAYLQIRIIEIRLFVRFDDMQGDFVADVPGIDIRGPRFVYGVKWDFWN